MKNDFKKCIFSFFVLLSILICVMGIPSLRASAATMITFTGAELLGRPTNNSISIKIVPDTTIEYHYQYGEASGVYLWQTPTQTATGSQVNEMVITGLSTDTEYFYRMRYHLVGELDWAERSEHRFHTQRASGDSFTFDITSDSHVNILLGNASTWTQTMNNVAGDDPDFLIDLGDTFAMDNVTSVAGAETAYRNQLQFFNLVSQSSAIFLAPGNHEQQEAWHLDDTSDPALSPPVIGTNAQKKFFLNPVPDGFYTGNTDTYSYLSGDHLKQDYYAWTWGEALFVVIDPYWYTTTKPYTGNTGGGEGSDTGSGDRWDWTLGYDQYVWLKQTLENSAANYKFIFAHHMVGGSDDYVRGGAVPANLVEWGGYDENGTTYGFDTKRPGWNDPIHQLLVDNNVSAFFHGHDHQYAYEERDGVVYQSLPAAGFSGDGFNIYHESDPYTIKVLPSPGHLRVTVNPAQTTVEYIGTTSGATQYSYDISPAVPPITHDLTVVVNPVGAGTTNPAVGVHSYTEGSLVNISATPNASFLFDHWGGAVADPTSASTSVTVNADMTITAYFVLAPSYLGDVNGDGQVTSTDALIILSGDVGLNVTQFCPMNCGDVNGDGLVNSTDALIILTYDIHLTVPFPVGQEGACPASVTPCPGCSSP
jgi:hypothetical protein